jgi:hypothetical protein
MPVNLFRAWVVQQERVMMFDFEEARTSGRISENFPSASKSQSPAKSQ